MDGQAARVGFEHVASIYISEVNLVSDTNQPAPAERCPTCGSTDKELYLPKCQDEYWSGKANPWHDSAPVSAGEAQSEPPVGTCYWKSEPHIKDSHFSCVTWEAASPAITSQPQLDWSAREWAVIQSIADKQDISPIAVIRQSLRVYQLIAEGHSKLVEINPQPKMAKGEPIQKGNEIESIDGSSNVQTSVDDNKLGSVELESSDASRVDVPPMQPQMGSDKHSGAIGGERLSAEQFAKKWLADNPVLPLKCTGCGKAMQPR